MKQHRGHRSRVAHIAVVLLGLVLAIVGLSSANANADPPGNNGTVKIDGTDLNDGPGHTQKPNDPFDEGTDNDPHIECGIKVDFFNFDQGQTADIVFTAHAPTGSNGLLLEDLDVTISQDGTAGAPNDVDESFIYDVEEDFDMTQFTSKHEVHGWHIKVNITIYDAEGNEVPGAKKHKVFWAEGCPPPPCEDDPQTDADECNPCVDDPQTDADECNPCVDDPQTDADECNPCVDDPQTDADECNPEVLPNTEDPKDPPEVLGEVTLPKTGPNTVPMLALSMGLLMIGGSLVSWSRKATAEVR